MLNPSNLSTASHYLSLDAAGRAELLAELASLVGSDFESISNDTNDGGLPQFREIQSGIAFRFVLPGSYSMGLPSEEAALVQLSSTPRVDLNSMKPAHEVTVSPFLISERPILLSEFRRLVSDYSNPNDLPDSFPVYVRRPEAERFALILGCRLPTEAEWEYVCRAMTTSLFVWGDHLPEYEELATWMEIDFDGRRHHARNRFGMQGLFTGTWCIERYRENYSSVDFAAEEYACRGGGSYFWPWQDEEWVWCISAQRFSSAMLDVDKTCGLFLVRDVV